MNVRVVGEQFTWTFYYPRAGRQGGRLRRSSTCPRASQVQFTVQSKDVLHDFWVPAFRMKIDAVPGIDTHLPRHARPQSATTRSSAPSCAGSATPSMRQTAHVVDAGASSTSGSPTARPAAGGGGGRRRPAAAAARRRDGKTIFTDAAGCGACHTLADAGTTGTIGPDLDKVLKGKDEAFIQQSIVDPNAEIADGLPGRDHAAELRARRSQPAAARCAGRSTLLKVTK